MHDSDKLILKILDSLSQIDYIHPEDIPDIDLYMDQVITFMDKHLSSTKRYPSDKLLTKTMINNYSKNNVLPPPDKKKYSREHILTLAFIYYFKNILSISDIQHILNPITDKYFGKEGAVSLEKIYTAIFDLEAPVIRDLSRDLEEKSALSKEAAKTLGDIDEKDRDYIEIFAFICLLASDVYLKKLMIEKIIDTLNPED